MEYRAIATISHYLGEDSLGVAIYEHHDHYGFSDPIVKQRTYTVDGAQMTGTVFYAFRDEVTVSVGDTISVDDEPLTVVAVKLVKRPDTRRVVHTEVIGGR